VPDPEAIEKIWFTPAEISEGWRLTCRHSGEAAELEYNSDWRLTFNLESAGLPLIGTEAGLAVDFGTTGLVAGLVDLESGRILLAARGYNPQRAWGADVMTRLVAARDPATLEQLQQVILNALSDAAEALHLRSATRLNVHLNRVLAVGNTAMLHFVAGIPETTLSVFPFHSPLESQPQIPVAWDNHTLNLAGPVQGFVGSDLLAVLRALELHSNHPPLIKGGREDLANTPPTLIMDLGTNSEIALWDGGGTG
jgi:uncharacterized 2Fe-2S/4Fe-4S cluster protein (DUF4445 family)